MVCDQEIRQTCARAFAGDMAWQHFLPHLAASGLHAGHIHANRTHDCGLLQSLCLTWMPQVCEHGRFTKSTAHERTLIARLGSSFCLTWLPDCLRSASKSFTRPHALSKVFTTTSTHVVPTALLASYPKRKPHR